LSDQDAVIRVTNDQFASNTYLVRTGEPGECILIDPGLDHNAIEQALAKQALSPSAILCTHGHFDHLGSAQHFSHRYGIPVHLDTADERLARTSNFMLMALKVRSRIQVPDAFVPIDEALTRVKGVKVLHVPGHTPGSVVLMIGGRAFTGDTIYRDDVWRMPWPEEDGDRLVESVRSLWEILPNDTWIHPGHGGAATFAAIKTRNIPLRRMLGLEAELAT
jgi:glyoxylase-like metal-dependent hydrolase (beta-lactamase superfamily II)